MSKKNYKEAIVALKKAEEIRVFFTLNTTFLELIMALIFN